MADIPVRELRNNVSQVLRRVEAGERLRVTVSGRPVAALVPLSDRPQAMPWQQLLSPLTPVRADPPPTAARPSPAPARPASLPHAAPPAKSPRARVPQRSKVVRPGSLTYLRISPSPGYSSCL